MTVQITGTRSTKRRSQKAEAYFHRNHTLSISYNIERQTDRTQYFIQDNINFKSRKSITSNTMEEKKGDWERGGLVYLQVTGSSCLKVTFHTNFEGGQGFALLQGLWKGVPHVDGVAGERIRALFSVKLGMVRSGFLEPITEHRSQKFDHPIPINHRSDQVIIYIF